MKPRITVYPTSEAIEMLKLLAGIKKKSAAALAAIAIEIFLQDALANGEFDAHAEVVRNYLETLPGEEEVA